MNLNLAVQPIIIQNFRLNGGGEDLRTNAELNKALPREFMFIVTKCGKISPLWPFFEGFFSI